MDLSWVLRNADMIWGYTLSHLYFTLVPTLLGLVISLPLGWLAAARKVTYGPVVGVTSLFYTIPSLALFVLMPKVLGTKILDPVNVVVALTIYTVALLVRVVADALLAVPAETKTAAVAMGYSPLQLLTRIELPLCVPSLVSGLRVVVVSNISIVTMAALVGVSQLGSLFTLGFTRRSLVPIVVGLVICVALAFACDRLLAVAGRLVSPWQRKGAM